MFCKNREQNHIRAIRFIRTNLEKIHNVNHCSSSSNSIELIDIGSKDADMDLWYAWLIHDDYVGLALCKSDDINYDDFLRLVKFVKEGGSESRYGLGFVEIVKYMTFRPRRMAPSFRSCL